MADNKYISDIAEAQPWSRKMGQVQVIVAGEGKDKKKKKVNIADIRKLKSKMAKKMK